MNFSHDNILVMGLGISGESILRALTQMQKSVFVYDEKKRGELSFDFSGYEKKGVCFYLGSETPLLDNITLIVKSPGIKPDHFLLKEAIKRKIPILSDIELAYRIKASENIIAVTGTNGKTTTTALIGEILKKAGKTTHVCGNIGVGVTDLFLHAGEYDFFVMECSSFQLEHTEKFKPHIAVMTNISPDHLDWHGSYERYIAAKWKIAQKMTRDDILILNQEDPLLNRCLEGILARKIYFSRLNDESADCFVRNGKIIIREGGCEISLLPFSDIFIPGDHNLENVLAAVSAAYFAGIDPKVISGSVREFKGVEHRIEYVDEIDGVQFFNDSKGTNPDASMKALQALKGRLILIAGGYDKNSSYGEFARMICRYVDHLILMGETAPKIKQEVEQLGFKKFYLVSDMQEAVQKAFQLAGRGMKILLSPASASWDMYSDYEERGRHFKNEVGRIRSLNHEQSKDSKR